MRVNVGIFLFILRQRSIISYNEIIEYFRYRIFSFSSLQMVSNLDFEILIRIAFIKSLIKSQKDVTRTSSSSEFQIRKIITAIKWVIRLEPKI